MKLFDKIKGKKDDKAQKTENVLSLVKEPSSAKATEGKPNAISNVAKDNTGRARLPLRGTSGQAHRILKHHHLSEKTNSFAAIGRYVFKVERHANKIEVKKAVEAVYDVHVAKVNMISVQGKKRRQGRSFGRTQDWKKAIVTLKTGERISGLAEGV